MDDRESLIHAIYEGVTDPHAWQDLLATLAERLGAAGAGLGVQDMATHSFWAVAEAGIDPGLHETYARLAPENKIWQQIGRTGRPMTDWMVMAKSELHRSALYAEWFAPQGFHGVMAAPMLARASLSGVVVAFCSENRGDFEEADLKYLADLAPHLGRAVALHLEREQLLTDLSASRKFFEDAEQAVLLLDADLRVLHANDAAKGLLNRGEELRLRNQRLTAQYHDDDAVLRRVLRPGITAAQAQPGQFAVVHRAEQRPLLLKVTPVASPERTGLLPGAAWLLKITDPEQPRAPDPRVLQRLFGLTAAEARVVLAMLPPHSESEAAARLGLGKTTFRWHLHHAYEKLDVNGRDQLVYLLTSYGVG
jgi:DNA-binding CsgD family transcriptional regulator